MATFLKNLKQIVNREKPISDVWYYIQGNIRYKLWYSKFKWWIPWHIRDQIKWRVKWMNPKCYEQGSCIMCGCETIHLQMCNKGCNKPCYPPMMSKWLWKLFKSGEIVRFEGKFWWVLENKYPRLLTEQEIKLL